MIAGIDAGFSRSKGWFPRLIMRSTNAWCSHCFIRFRMAGGTRRVFESTISGRGFSEQNPDYYDPSINPAIEAVAYVPMFADQDRMSRALELCEQWIGARPYPIVQLAWIYLSQRYGFRVPRSESKLICSEALSVVINELGIDLRDEWHPTWDSVTPGSAWNHLMALFAGYGSFAQLGRGKEASICGSGYSKYYSLRPRRP